MGRRCIGVGRTPLRHPARAALSGVTRPVAVDQVEDGCEGSGYH